MARTRILVVNEHPLLRHGIIAFINGQPDMIACGEADSVPTVQNKLAETKPRLVLIGLRLGAGDSLELVKAIKAQIPELLVLVYSAFEETIFAERALRAGAHGYVMKKAPKEELLMAIRDIVQDRIYVSRDVAMRAFKKALQTRPEHRLSRTASAVENLSDREMHIFQLLGSGLGKDKSLTP
jgi:DNA-binding NarL/FixJ family response regulator